MLKLTYSNLEFQNFPGEDPRTPSSRGGEGREGRRGRGKGREGGRGRIGKEGTGEEGGGRNGGGEGGEGKGGALDMGSAPLERSSGSAPACLLVGRHECRFCSRMGFLYETSGRPDVTRLDRS